tara:strand:+ start:1305 stop:1409 length:105 start_codon:yes stop_codon:yes gene_type:complete
MILAIVEIIFLNSVIGFLGPCDASRASPEYFNFA